MAEEVEAADLLRQEAVEMVEMEQVLLQYLEHHHNLFMDQLLEFMEAEQEVVEEDLQEQRVELAERVEVEMDLIMDKEHLEQLIQEEEVEEEIVFLELLRQEEKVLLY